MKTVILNINGMRCEGCVQQISKNLDMTAGVSHVEVDLMSGSARIEMDERRCTTADLVAAVRRAGFQVDGFHAAEAAV